MGKEIIPKNNIDILEYVPDAIVVVHSDGRIIFVNSQAEKVFGYNRDELIGKQVEMLVPERLRGLHIGHRSDYYSRPTPRPMGLCVDITCLRKDGSEFPADISLSPVEMEEGLFIISDIRDITERKKAEDALKASEKEYRNLADNAIAGIYKSNLKGDILYVNDALARMYGFKSPDDMVSGGALSRYKNPKDRDIMIERLKKTGKVADYELEVLTKRGETKNVLIGATLEGETLSGMVIDITQRKLAEEEVRRLNEDLECRIAERTVELKAANMSLEQEIVERKRSEEAVRQSELFLKSIVENIPDMIFVKDAKELKFVRFNKAGEELIGYSRDELIGRNDYDFFPKDEAEFFTTKDRLVLKEGKLLDIPEEPLNTKNRGVRILHTKKIPILDKEGMPQYLLGISEDITERKKTEEQIHALNVELERQVINLKTANKELDAFSYSVSHDLRAPLRSIDGFSQALLEDYMDKLNDQGKDFLVRIRAATTRMTQLIDDMLSLSRVTRSELHPEKVDLSALVNAIVSDLRRIQPERKVEFVISPGLVAHGDARLLRIALENLLGNSWKFTGRCPEAKIEFGAVEQQGKPAYFVRDNGAGFDMAYAEKLFGAFQRLHGMTEFPGTGIGLATVQRIIHRHGGDVWAEGKIEQGAAFYFTLSLT